MTSPGHFQFPERRLTGHHPVPEGGALRCFLLRPGAGEPPDPEPPSVALGPDFGAAPSPGPHSPPPTTPGPSVTRFISRLRKIALAFAGTTLAGALAAAEAVPPAQAPAVPELGASVLRVLGALVFVLGLFFVGLWLARNGQRFAWRRGRSPRLNVFEARSLGGRQTLYVVGYQEQRFLIGAAPHGLTLIATLPSDPGTVADTVAPPFAETLRAVLQRSP